MKLFKQKYYRYRVKTTYRKNNREVFRVLTTVGVRKQKQIEDHREIKQTIIPGILRKVDKHLLCNGIFDVEPTCYLGRW